MLQILLDHGAPLFAHNIAGQTPCEAAAQAKHEDIAKLLECKMVLMVSKSNIICMHQLSKNQVYRIMQLHVWVNITDYLHLLQETIIYYYYVVL